MKWSYCCIGFGLCFGLGIVFTYWIQGQLFYEDVRNFLLTGTSFAVIIGLIYGGSNLFVTLYKERKEEKKNAIINLEEHTEQLLPILKKWAEQPLTPPTEYLFSFAQQHIVSSDKSLHNMIQGNDGINNIKSQYNGLQKKISEYIRNAMERQFLKNSQDTVILGDLVREIRDFHEKRKSMKRPYTFKVNPMPSTIPNQYQLQSQRSDGSIKATYLTGKKKNLQALANNLNSLLVDSSLQTMTETLLNLGNQIYELHRTFKERIDSMINGITYGIKEDKILTGTCEICKAIKNKWHIR
jgi:hypothetical protein